MITKEKINEITRRHCLPDAKTVYVRHCTEEVSIEGRSPWGGTCFLIHPDVTVLEFFSKVTQREEND
jgi:hypothetical protein